MNIVDTMILNLKIISNIPENGKIKRSDQGILEIESTYKFNWIIRYFRGDSRSRTLEDIESLIRAAIEKNNEIINSKYFTEHNKIDINNSFILSKMELEYYKQYELLKLINSELKSVIKGLMRLRSVYSEDITTVSKIDILISKINTHTKEIDKKITF